MMKKLLSILLIFMMMFSITPMSAFAETEEILLSNSEVDEVITEENNDVITETDEVVTEENNDEENNDEENNDEENNDEENDSISEEDVNCIQDAYLSVANSEGKTIEDFANNPLLSGIAPIAVGDRVWYEVEPNNTARQADRILNDFTVHGTLSRTDRLDYFEFQIAERCEVTVVSLASKRSLLIGIIDSSNQAVAAGDDLGYSGSGYYGDGLNTILDPGTYYIVPLDENSSSVTYTFYLEITPTHTHSYTSELDPVCDCGLVRDEVDFATMLIEREPNDDRNNAVLIRNGENAYGSLSSNDLVDGYKFTIEETSEVYIIGRATSNKVEFGLIDISEIDNEDALMKISVDTQIEGTMYDTIYCLLEPGEYHILVLDENVSMGALRSVDYTFFIDIEPHEHSFASTNTILPTCVNQGYTTYSCECGESYNANFVNPTGQHTYQHVLDTTCDVCGFVRDAEIDEPNVPTGLVAMFRMYNPNSGEHFYTGSSAERNNLIYAGWNYEGVAWNAPTQSGEHVYRLYNPNSGDHHYTMSVAERDMLVGYGWQYEGVAWNSASSENVPQYRLYNPNAVCGSHHYTSSIEEREMLVSVGWILEGIGWYGIQ